MGFNLGPTLTALENQGMTKRVYDGAVSMQSGQRSLTSASGADNASSNAAASIKSGGRVELTIPSTSGNIIRQIDYGVNLDFFSPQVSPDGTITLRVRGQINEPATPLPTTGVPNILSFTNSEAQSTITFKSGQTVLMSGLMSTNETSSTVGGTHPEQHPADRRGLRQAEHQPHADAAAGRHHRHRRPVAPARPSAPSVPGALFRSWQGGGVARRLPHR